MINNRVNLIIPLLLALGGFAAPAATSEQTEMANNVIQIYQNNPRYWQYKGEPVLLLGGSDDDNLFQWTGSRLTEHLDLLKSVGGNYVRCTMSSRDESNVWPFARVDGKYNLDQWNEEYWQRFEEFLKATSARDIIVQIEIWATYDFKPDNRWQQNPFHPKNNINYTVEEIGLPKQVNSRPGYCENSFFWSVPAERNQQTMLKYQRQFVDKVLSCSLKFGNVLYCMDNETSVTPQWGKYWAQYIKTKAKKAAVVVQATEMWYDHLDKNPPIPHATFDDPETYSFVDVSQNSHKRGQRHWDSLRLQLSRVDDRVRPLTNVKIYGADTGPERWFRADVDGVERFWRNIFGGMASARFHRPPAGLGLTETAQANIRSMRTLMDEMNVFTCEAHNDLLSDRKPNEAYCLANPGKRYAVYFPDGGEVVLDIGLLKEPGTIRWLEISTSKWGKQQVLKSARSVTLRPPDSGPWVVLLARRGEAAGTLAGDVTFTRTQLTTVAETNAGYVAIADLNGDGTADLAAGLQWFEGPSWIRHPLYPTDANTLIDIGKTVPYDVDRDGDLDLVANRRPQELFWFENPGAPSTGTWTKHHITRRVKYPELLMFVDIDGDGRDEMVGSDDGPGYGIRIYEIPDDPRKSSNWSWTTIDDSPLHGLGIGDLNQDGRLDLVSDFVWFRQTPSGGWTKHSLPAPDEDNRGHLTMQINVSDVDGDADQDVLLTRAHSYGAFWLESSGGRTPRFTLHEILPGSLPSQLHGVAYGDIDGDGDVDMFAGTCRYRHGDPGEKDPLDVFWVELVRKEGRVSWVKHQLATDLVMGFNPTIGDVDGDGDMDLALRGLGLGGKYVIGARQTDVTLFIQNAPVAATAELPAKSAQSVTLHPPPDSGSIVVLPARENILPYGKRQGVLRVVYDNDQTLDVYTDEVLMAMGSAGRIQLVGMITTRTVNGIGYDKYDELVAERRQMVNLARKSGMRRLPDPVKGPRVSLQPPASGKIEDTGTIGSEGSWLIVREARKASPSNPLVVICGGQLTSVADAYLLDNSIADKVVVAWLDNYNKGMTGFNGWSDGWAAFITLEKLRLVQFTVQSRPFPHVPKSRLHTLPDTEAREYMLAIQTDVVAPEGDADGPPAISLMQPDYVRSAKRVSFGGWITRDGHDMPLFRDDPNGRAIVVVGVDRKVATEEWWRAMKNPATWLPTNGTSTRSSKKGSAVKGSDRVRISPRNPRYFEYKGTPVFLTGARELEMLPRVGNYPYKQAVDRLAEAGCNHWRIEMYLSDSNQEGKRKYPIVSTYKSWWHDPATGKQEQLDAYQKNDQGKFDLNLFNEPFWNRFQDFCELCAKRGIVLTVEIWSTYAIWATSPFNPKNNINYSGPLNVGKHGRDADSEFSFVRTVPALGNRSEILKFQKKFAKKVLDCTWQAGNVLYVCGNENGWPREWVEYWAEFVHKYGKSKGVRLLYTNIPEHIWHRASSGEVEYLFHPAMEDVLTRNRFDFADMSQLPGGKYPPSKLPKYETVVDWYKRSKNTPRPITMLKNYVGMDEKADVGKKRRDALTYFMAGAAMSGFHRPWAGGCPEERWNNCAEKMRKVYLSSLEAAGQVATFTSGVEFVDTSRRNDLVSRGWCLANPGKHYIVYLKKGGESVDAKLEPGSYRCKAFDGQLWSREDKFEWLGGWRTFSKAGNEDWGIYIVREQPQTH